MANPKRFSYLAKTQRIKTKLKPFART